jgi:hypothetical protein
MLGQIRELSGVRALVCLALLAGAAIASPPHAPNGSPRAEDSEWVASGTVARAVQESPATLDVELVARGGFHVNEEYPLNFQPAPSAAADFAKPRFDRADGLVLEPCAAGAREACRARLPIAFTPRTAGAVSVGGTLSFSVCSAEKCLIRKVDLAVPVEVSPR